MSTYKKGLETKKSMGTILAMAVAAVLLAGGIVIPSVYAKTTHSTSEFETSVTPFCTSEEVVYSGTVHFDVYDKDGSQRVHIHYSNVHGVGVDTGTKYTVHGNDKYDINLNPNGDTTFSTTLHGTVVSSGPGDNTKVTIKQVQIIHANGDTETIVDSTEITCPG